MLHGQTGAAIVAMDDRIPFEELEK